MNQEEYDEATRIGIPAEGRVNGIVRGGAIYNGYFYTMVGMSRVKYPVGEVSELKTWKRNEH